jgi:hypothetical protein
MSKNQFPSDWKEALAFEWAKNALGDHTTPDSLAKSYLQAKEIIEEYDKERDILPSEKWSV